MECEYTNDVARCDVDMNGTCQLDAGVFCCTNYGRRSSPLGLLELKWWEACIRPDRHAVRRADQEGVVYVSMHHSTVANLLLFVDWTEAQAYGQTGMHRVKQAQEAGHRH